MAPFQKRYNPNRSADWNYGGVKWKLSRSKIDLFMECPRCFFLDNKLGTKRPQGPAFTINVAVDTLFKKEFDVCRKKKSRHPIMEQYNIDALPFLHEDLDMWRDNFEGIQFLHKPTGLVVSGAIDDVWQGSDGKLIVVDYKATSKAGKIETLADSSWEEQYRRQIGVYQWLLQQKGFQVAPIGYFVYANANSDTEVFDAHLEFEVTLVPCEGTLDWIEPTLQKIKVCLDADTLPPIGELCEYCPYREAAGKKLQAVHRGSKG